MLTIALLTSATKRLTRGPLGKFAGDDFPCYDFACLYDLEADPRETRNLINDAALAGGMITTLGSPVPLSTPEGFE